LHTYSTEVKDGKIFVTANLKTVTSKMGRSPIARAKAKKNRSAATDQPKSSISPPDHETKDEKVVIVGGGSAGLHTVEALREHGFDGSITLISKEKYAPFDRTKLSKALITDAGKLAWRSEEELKGDFKVNLQLGTEVTKIDRQNKTVETSKGDKVQYDKLVLAPGSVTKKLPIDGVDLENIFTMRGLEDSQAIVAGELQEISMSSLKLSADLFPMSLFSHQ
jgi:heterodisulfide reductase subunit A-like polyferredoxin